MNHKLTYGRASAEDSIPPAKNRQREQIADATKHFLKSGGKINVIPTGVSAYDIQFIYCEKSRRLVHSEESKAQEQERRRKMAYFENA